MTGASKLVIEDIHRLRELFEQGFNNTQIARVFTPIKGEKISREHISQIRHKKRWNFDDHSFVAKENLPINESISTILEYDDYKTKLGYVITEDGNFHVYLRYKNESFLLNTETPLMQNKPSTEEMLKYHNKWIWDEISKF